MLKQKIKNIKSIINIIKDQDQLNNKVGWFEYKSRIIFIGNKTQNNYQKSRLSQLRKRLREDIE